MSTVTKKGRKLQEISGESSSKKSRIESSVEVADPAKVCYMGNVHTLSSDSVPPLLRYVLQEKVNTKLDSADRFGNAVSEIPRPRGRRPAVPTLEATQKFFVYREVEADDQLPAAGTASTPKGKSTKRATSSATKEPAKTTAPKNKKEDDDPYIRTDLVLESEPDAKLYAIPNFSKSADKIDLSSVTYDLFTKYGDAMTCPPSVSKARRDVQILVDRALMRYNLKHEGSEADKSKQYEELVDYILSNGPRIVSKNKSSSNNNNKKKPATKGTSVTEAMPFDDESVCDQIVKILNLYRLIRLLMTVMVVASMHGARKPLEVDPNEGHKQVTNDPKYLSFHPFCNHPNMDMSFINCVMTDDGASKWFANRIKGLGINSMRTLANILEILNEDVLKETNRLEALNHGMTRRKITDHFGLDPQQFDLYFTELSMGYIGVKEKSEGNACSQQEYSDSEEENEEEEEFLLLNGTLNQIIKSKIEKDKKKAARTATRGSKPQQDLEARKRRKTAKMVKDSEVLVGILAKGYNKLTSVVVSIANSEVLDLYIKKRHDHDVSTLLYKSMIGSPSTSKLQQCINVINMRYSMAILEKTTKGIADQFLANPVHFDPEDDLGLDSSSNGTNVLSEYMKLVKGSVNITSSFNSSKSLQEGDSDEICGKEGSE